ncbi:MAG: NUDIX hydrolase [Faecousia sp.]
MKNTTLGYIERDGCYLLLHRIKKENDLNKDKWIGIGGKLEENESPEEGMLREAKEETGLTVYAPRYCGIVTFVSDVWEGEYMHLFHITDFDGQLCECDEGVLEWIPKERFAKLPQWEGDKLFLRLMQENIPFFSLKLQYEGDRLLCATLNGKQL